MLVANLPGAQAMSTCLSSPLSDKCDVSIVLWASCVACFTISEFNTVFLPCLWSGWFWKLLWFPSLGGLPLLPSLLLPHELGFVCLFVFPLWGNFSTSRHALIFLLLRPSLCLHCSFYFGHGKWLMPFRGQLHSKKHIFQPPNAILHVYKSASYTITSFPSQPPCTFPLGRE